MLIDGAVVLVVVVVMLRLPLPAPGVNSERPNPQMLHSSRNS